MSSAVFMFESCENAIDVSMVEFGLPANLSLNTKIKAKPGIENQALAKYKVRVSWLSLY